MQEDGNKKQKARAKGVERSAIAKIKHEQYKACLFGKTNEERLQYAEFSRIDTENHNITTQQQTKISLSILDDKRHYMDVINSRAHGHYKNAIDVSQ